VRHACKLGPEGIVSKRKDSAYRSGRSSDWLKMKNAAARQ
jgi:bifunctional non-homologous end joining protein LigD